MFTADLFERVIRTFLVVFIATFASVFAAPADVTNAGGWKAAAIAAVLASFTAAGTAVLGVVTKPVGLNKDTPSILPSTKPVDLGVNPPPPKQTS